MVGGESDDQLWGSGRGIGCHCWVPSEGTIVVCYGWGESDQQRVPLLSAIVVSWLGG